MEDASLKRKLEGQGNGSHKAPRLDKSAIGNKMSFAQRMMAKMGYTEGSGLGKDGEGMLNPIEVKQRPQGAGVGAVKEKTEQYKQEQRRAAEKRGEEYEDSSEEERKARRLRQKMAHHRPRGIYGGLGASSSEALGKVRTRYRTVADVQAAAPGLDVPPAMLGSILDATGSQTRLLTSTAGLFISSSGTSIEPEAEKIAKRERVELEAFIDAWHGVQEQKVYVEEHEGQVRLEIEQRQEEMEKLQDVVNAIEAMTLDVEGEDLDGIITALERLQEQHEHDVERYELSEVAVGALVPHFKKFVNEWNPCTDTGEFSIYLERIKPLLGLTASETAITQLDHALLDPAKKKQRCTTPYETLMYTIWLPKMRTTITNWQVLEYAAIIAVVETWRPLLPLFIYAHVIEQLIIPKLKSALQTWDPRKRNNHHRHHNDKHQDVKHANPHTWIFPWLQFLPSEQMDLRTHDGLLNEIQRRLRHVVDGWNIAWQVIPGINELKTLLGSEFDHLLVRHLLPRLARYLSANFEVNPAAEDITPLQHVLSWQDLLKPDILARLLAAEFFPKWLRALHDWLTTDDASFDEIGQWKKIWMQQMPEKIADHSNVLRGWAQGDEMFETALSIMAKGQPLSVLPAPVAGPARPIAKELERKTEKADSQALRPQYSNESTDFKDIVEEWCTEENLTMLPLREAHPSNGLPLFRITASASGKGGVVVYLQRDMVWARRKDDRASYDPIGMDENLLARAEGR